MAQRTTGDARSWRRASRSGRLGTLTAAALLLAGCSSDGQADTSADELTHVTLALNYIPDPSLNGLTFAMQQGLFEDAGLDVELIPFGSTPAESLVASGQADLGLATDLRTALLATASGAELVSYMATYQHVPYSLTVLADSSYQRPADLAGTTYGGFGSPMELAVVDDMITADGGSAGADEYLD
ncbi:MULTISPECIES: ABC transporter substrate-binding protein [unclassified Modestobacter]